MTRINRAKNKFSILYTIIVFQLMFTGGLIVQANGFTVEEPKGIHLNIPEDPRHNIAVNWYTKTDTETSIEYGLQENNLTGTVTGEVEVVRGDTRIHHTVITNLLANFTYFYRVGGSVSGWSQIHNFTTAPEVGNGDLHFAVYGDNRSDRNLRRWINRLILQNETTSFDTPMSFIMHMGDFVSRGNQYELFDGYWEDSQMINSRIPIIPIQGNHEFGGVDESYYREQFVLPENGNKEWSYALRYGPAFIMGIDSEDHGVVPYDTQSVRWIERALEVSNNDPFSLWNLGIFHQPLFVSSSHDPRLDLRKSWGPVFDAEGVDIIFNGHCHLYERSYPVSADSTLDLESDQTGTANYIDPKYPIYIVTGAGGRGGPIGALPERDNEYMAFQNYTWSFVDVMITTNDTSETTTLQAKVIGVLPQFYENETLNEFDVSQTVLLDEFSITKLIPAEWYSSSESSYPYTEILSVSPSKVKILGIGLTIGFAILIGVVDLIILQSRKQAKKNI